MYGNNYSNMYGYNYGQPYNYQMPSYTPTQAQTNTNKIYVSGIDDAKKRPLPSNSDFILLDNDKPILYQKLVDGTGQFEIKVFDIVPHVEQTEDMPGYVLKDEFETLKNKLTEIETKLLKGDSVDGTIS